MLKENKKRLQQSFLCLICLLFICSVIDGVLTSVNFRKVRGSLKVFDRDNNLIYESISDSEGYQTPVLLHTLPNHVRNAVISAEDSRYYRHFGVDIYSIIRATLEDLRHKKIVSGASTITQQVARANLVSAQSNRYIRKLREINSAIYLELFYTKDRILEKYLSSVYFGHNAYGIESASQTYFKKPARLLTVGESAALAGSIKSPTMLNPVDTTMAQNRRNEVLTLMRNTGKLSQNDYITEIGYPLGLNLMERQQTFLHFVDYAIAEAISVLHLKTRADLKGYEIHTTMSSSLSEAALKSARSNINRLIDAHKVTNAAVVILDTDDSAILAMIGSIDYFDDKIDGAVNVAISNRQPGSALKPFTYGQAFYEGLLSPDDFIIDEKTSFIDKNGESFVPYNYNGIFNGKVSVKVALASSLNLPAVKVLQLVGVEDMISAATRAGIKTLNNPNRYDLSVTLGGGEVTLLDLTNAYNSLARKGIYKQVYSVNMIKDDKAVTIYAHSQFLGEPVWDKKSEQISSMLFSILSDKSAKVLGFGRNNVFNVPFSIASKTGTTTDWHDNWTFGYTDKFSVGVWAGNSDNSPMFKIDGITGAGSIWRDVVIAANDYYNSTNKNENDNRSLSHEINNESIESSTATTLRLDPNATLKLLNPVENTKYYADSLYKQFEKIEFKVSVDARVYQVEYILDGRTIGSSGKADDYRILWTPEKGNHAIVALFLDGKGRILVRRETNFSVF